MTDPVRIALIGAGAIGRRHLATVGDSRDCVLAAIVDPAPAAALLAHERGVTLFADVAAMLDATKPDGVIVASPNALHLPHALAGIARGIPLLLEKPVADTMENAARIVAAAERAGVAVLVGHHRRHNPIVQAARDAVADGRIGRLVAASALSLFAKAAGYFDIAWHREAGAGTLLINLIHDIDYLRFIGGEIDSVLAQTSSGVRGLPVDDTAAIILRFASGALGTVTGSDATPAPWSWDMTSRENPAFVAQGETCLMLCGTEGALSLPDLSLWRYPHAPDWMRPIAQERLAVTPADPYARQLAHFCDVIRGAAAPLVGVADATRTLAVAMAAHRSAASGRAETP